MCGYALLRLPFASKSGIGRLRLLILFAVKVLAGIAYGLFYRLPRYYTTADTWRYFEQSKTETTFLKNNPVAFVTDLFTHGYSQPGNLFSGENSYWNDLKSNTIVKLMAICNVFTGSSYWVNVVVFNFVFIWGLVALYRVFAQATHPAGKVAIWPILTGTFLLPSTLFWCSGLHKDGLLLSATGLLMYLLAETVAAGKTPKIGSLLAMLLLAALVFMLRNFVLMALVPPLLAWMLANKLPQYAGRVFLLVFGAGLVAFFTMPLLFPALNPPLYVANKQFEFSQLSGGSEVAVDQLKPTLAGFIRYLPTALDLAFLRPRPSEITNAAHLMAFLENLLLLSTAIAWVLVSRNRLRQHFCRVSVFFGLSLVLLAGYTVTFSGAIVRYRSFALPFIITPLLIAIWPDMVLFWKNRVKTRP